jgi:hypothetical protein
MNNSSAPASLFSWIFRLVLLGLGIFAVYWVYKKLYSGPEDTSILMKDIHVANKPYSYGVVPPVFEGGEYSLSSWIYINDYASDTRRGKNKDILKLGDFSTGGGTLVVGLYLDAYDNTMHVITSSTATVAPGGGAAGPASVPQGRTTISDYDSKFAGVGSTGPQTSANDCKVSPIGYQRWVHVAVVLDGKTVDVYLDGKLARSCILPSVFAATSNATVKVADNGGFGGYLSGVVANAYAMNPEQVYRQYMAGPLGSISMWEYIKSFFDPKSIGTLDYPKMN